MALVCTFFLLSGIPRFVGWQCEDERFELDMVIEAGSSAINLLDPMGKEIENMDHSAGVSGEHEQTRVFPL